MRLRSMETSVGRAREQEEVRCGSWSGKTRALSRTQSRAVWCEDATARPHAVKGVVVADGHAVDTVGDGSQALGWAQTYSYDLVILDVILPGLDGFAV